MELKRNRKQVRNFSLMEVIIAITIVALVAVIAVPNVIEKLNEGKKQAAIVQISSFKQAIDTFQLKHSKLPDSLDELVSKGIVEKIDADPWGNSYVYSKDGSKFNGYEIISYGQDGQPGGENFATDLTLSK